MKKILCYDMDDKLNLKLLTKTNFDQKLFNVKNYSKALNLIDEFDKLIVFNWKNGYKLLNRFKDKSKNNMFPFYDSTMLIKSRIAQLGYYTQSLYSMNNNLKRYVYDYRKLYIDGYDISELIPSEKIVLKIGNDHQGINKFLVDNSIKGIDSIISNNKVKKILEDNLYILIEQYIENARSIRVIIIKDKAFMVEHINPNNWIKNVQIDDEFQEIVNPVFDDNYYRFSIIDKAREIAKYFNVDFCGIDFLVTNDRFYFLEINDMIGLPDNDEMYDCVVAYFKEFIDN